MARISLSLAFVILSVSILIPTPAAAQSVSLCQMEEHLPFSMRKLNFWAQEQVVVEGHTLTLIFCAPWSRDLAAQNMLDLATRALPVLDQLTAIRLNNSSRRVFYLDADQKLTVIGADGAMDEHNRIFLHGGSLDSTVVHELAHYWADLQRFSELWMSEAYAEYLTHLAMPELSPGFRIVESTPAICDEIPLTHWRRDSAEAEACPYTAGAQVFHDLAVLVTEDTLRRVIGEIVENYGHVDSQKLYYELERASGANLSPLVRGRVFGPEHDGRLNARAALHDRYATASDWAGSLGASLPPSLFEDLRSWRDDRVAANLDQIEALLRSADLISGRCAELALPCARPWEQALGDPGRWDMLWNFFAGAPQPLSTYEQLRAKAAELGVPIPESLRQRAGELDEGGAVALQNALAVLAAASDFEGRCASLGLNCRAAWQQQWERGDLGAMTGSALGAAFDAGLALEGRCGNLAERCRHLWQEALARSGPTAGADTVADLDELLRDGATLEASCGNLATNCGELWRQALSEGTPTKAWEMIDALDKLLARGEALDTRCYQLASPCPSVWRYKLAAGSLDGANKAIDELEALLAHAAEVEGDCAEAGWRCPHGWRAALEEQGPGEAWKVLGRQAAALDGLQSVESKVRDGEYPLLAVLSNTSIGDPLAAARDAFARGDVAEAERLARDVGDNQARRQQASIAAAMLGIFLAAALFMALLAVALRLGTRPATPRRPVQPSPGSRPALPTPPARRAGHSPGAASGSDLLAQLLSTPLEDRRP